MGNVRTRQRPPRSWQDELKDLEKGDWVTFDGEKIPISKMTLGHLSSLIRLLAGKVDEHKSDKVVTAILETMLDLLYAELGKRDKEIDQDRGLLRALVK